MDIIHTAVVLSSEGEYHGTVIAATEPELATAVRQNYDPEGEYAGPTEGDGFWELFAMFYDLSLYPEVHDLSTQTEPEPGSDGELAVQCLDQLADLLSRSEWNADLMEPVFNLVRQSGRTIEDAE